MTSHNSVHNTSVQSMTSETAITVNGNGTERTENEGNIKKSQITKNKRNYKE